MPLTSAEKMRAMRARNIEAGLCEHSAKHGPATRGRQCSDCYTNGLRLKRKRRGTVADIDEAVKLRQSYEVWRLEVVSHCGKFKADHDRGRYVLLDLKAIVDFIAPDDLEEDSRIEVIFGRGARPQVKIANFCVIWSDFEAEDIGEIIIASAKSIA